MNGIGKFQHGFTLLEVLITIVILAFGLLGLTNLQAKLHMSQMESYQRAQAVVLLQDLANRIQANGANAANYVTVTPLGTGNTTDCVEPDPADCSPALATRADQDRYEWQMQLLGAAEYLDANNNNAHDAGEEVYGGMLGARGCVAVLPVGPGSCAPSSYLITVAWQGLFETSAPGLTCGQNQYGNDALRRAVSTTVTVGLPKCL